MQYPGIVGDFRLAADLCSTTHTLSLDVNHPRAIEREHPIEFKMRGRKRNSAKQRGGQSGQLFNIGGCRKEDIAANAMIGEIRLPRDIDQLLEALGRAKHAAS